MRAGLRDHFAAAGQPIAGFARAAAGEPGHDAVALLAGVLQAAIDRKFAIGRRDPTADRRMFQIRGDAPLTIQRNIAQGRIARRAGSLPGRTIPRRERHKAFHLAARGAKASGTELPLLAAGRKAAGRGRREIERRRASQPIGQSRRTLQHRFAVHHHQRLRGHRAELAAIAIGFHHRRVERGEKRNRLGPQHLQVNAAAGEIAFDDHLARRIGLDRHRRPKLRRIQNAGRGQHPIAQGFGVEPP